MILPDERHNHSTHCTRYNISACFHNVTIIICRCFSE